MKFIHKDDLIDLSFAESLEETYLRDINKEYYKTKKHEKYIKETTGVPKENNSDKERR